LNNNIDFENSKLSHIKPQNYQSHQPFKPFLFCHFYLIYHFRVILKPISDFVGGKVAAWRLLYGVCYILGLKRQNLLLKGQRRTLGT
jgi:hypothetical protein